MRSQKCHLVAPFVLALAAGAALGAHTDTHAQATKRPEATSQQTTSRTSRDSRTEMSSSTTKTQGVVSARAARTDSPTGVDDSIMIDLRCHTGTRASLIAAKARPRPP